MTVCSQSIRAQVTGDLSGLAGWPALHYKTP
jgi:hypothetical protein